jgi:hypothetical protein
MKILILFLAFNSSFIFSQNIGDLRKADTLYIYFDYKNEEKKIVLQGTQNQPVAEQYFFYLNCNRTEYLMFPHSYYSNQALYVNKEFLRKNKINIITLDFMKKNNIVEVHRLLLRAKKIYIIDKKDRRKNEVKVKEVIVMSSIIFEE